MSRVGEYIPTPSEELTPFLQADAPEAIAEASLSLNKFDPLPFAIIPDLLTEEGLSLLEDLEVPTNGKCPEEVLAAHIVGGPLAETMGSISAANRDMRHEPNQTIHSLKNETGVNLVLAPHRDLLDGHAVLFNYGVSGNLAYILDGEPHDLKANELVILNGAAVWGDVTNYLPGHETDDPYTTFRHLGGVTITHSVVGTGLTSRNRLLVYADGRETSVTQIPPELPPWF